LFLSTLKTINKDAIANNIVKLVVDIDIDEKKLEKLEAALGKLGPWQFTVDHNTVTATLEDVENIDSIDIKGMFDEFYEQLGLEDDQLERVKNINSELFEKNKQ